MANTGSGLPAPKGPALSRSSSSASVAPPAETIASAMRSRADEDRLALRDEVLVEELAEPLELVAAERESRRHGVSAAGLQQPLVLRAAHQRADIDARHRTRRAAADDPSRRSRRRTTACAWRSLRRPGDDADHAVMPTVAGRRADTFLSLWVAGHRPGRSSMIDASIACRSRLLQVERRPPARRLRPHRRRRAGARRDRSARRGRRR